VANGNTAFAADLYQALRGDQANLFYSPLSISIALAMTYAGARGETAEQMAETMHYDLAQPGLHAALNSLDLLLAGRGEGAKGKDGKGFRLNVVNAIWGQRDYHFETAYLDTIAVNYGAGVRLLDYVKEPDNSRKIINQWVSDQTEQRIKDLIPAGVIDNMTRLVLTNAVYFNAAWANPFAKEATRAGDFLCADGATVKKQMMSANESFGYASGDGWQLVELPYDRNELAMDIILPDEGGWTAFEDDLTAERLAGMLAEIQSQQVQLTMPKFEFENEFSLGRTLAAMGMPVAFTGDADFSGITGKRDLHIGEVIHKSFVAVDEAGTEAAAATAVVMRLTAMPAEPVVVNVDRPFVFLIRDLETGVVLFMGRVVQ
jgi:serpin B